MKEMVILTGGIHTKNFVTVYNNKGFVEDWPRMEHGRSNHGCGHYVNTENRVVNKIYHTVNCLRSFLSLGHSVTRVL